MTTRRPAVWAVIVAVLVLRGVSGAADPAITCRAAKMVAAGVFDLCRLRADAKAARLGGVPDVARCNAKLTADWARAESRANGACPTTGDAATIAAQVIGDVAAIEAALTPTTTSTTTPVPTTTSTSVAGVACGTFPGCGGTCPAGQSCFATVAPGPMTSCTCLTATATACGSTGGSIGDGPKCGGACPAGEVCSTLYVDEALSFTCGCIAAGTTPCLSFSGPCPGGACPAGMSCGADPLALFACACQ